MPPKGVPLTPEQKEKLALARAKAHEAIKAKAEVSKTMNTKEKQARKELVRNFVKELKNPEPQPEAQPEPEPESEPEEVPEVVPEKVEKKAGRPRKVVNSKLETKVEIKEPEKPEKVEKIEKVEKPEKVKKAKKIILSSDSDSSDDDYVEVRVKKDKLSKLKKRLSEKRPKDYEQPPDQFYEQKIVVPEKPRINYSNHLISLCKAGYQFN
jgi:hypothetical protein